VRAIATDVLCSGIKTAGSTQVLPVLPVVVPVLLEALSGLEDARLNYVEQVGYWMVISITGTATWYLIPAQAIIPREGGFGTGAPCMLYAHLFLLLQSLP
jgi:hypothetical protein